MTEQTYAIYFEGNIVDGFAIGKVRKNLAALFKANEEQINTLFSGKRVAVKKNLDQATAEKYAAAMAANGAIVIAADAAGNILKTAAGAPDTATIRKEPEAAGDGADAATTAADTPDTDSANDDKWSLAPAGADLVKTAERKEVAALEIDVSHLSLESIAGKSKGKAVFGAKDLPEQVEADNATAEPQGGAAVEAKAAQAEDDPSGLSLAAVGATLGDTSKKEEQPLPEFDLGDLSLAEVGADLAPDRPQAVIADAPSIDHIALIEEDIDEDEAANGK